MFVYHCITLVIYCLTASYVTQLTNSLNFKNIHEKNINQPLKTVVFDIDNSESDSMLPDIMQDYQRTHCFPGFYTIITKTENSNYNVTRNNAIFHYLLNSYRYLTNDYSRPLQEAISKYVANNSTIDIEELHKYLKEISELQARNKSLDARKDEDLYYAARPGSNLSKDNSIYLPHDEKKLDENMELPWIHHADEQSFWKGERDKTTIREVQAELMRQYMDTRVDPCQDFYQYACGNWGKLNPIPKDKITFDTFEMLKESLDIVLQELLEERITNNDFEAHIKAKHLYHSCINYKVIEQRGNKPLIDLLAELGHWPILTQQWDSSTFDALETMANLRLFGNDILLSVWVGPDIKNSDEYVIQFDQASLGLTRDYFLQPANYVYLKAYRNYMIRVAELLGASNSTIEQEVNDIVAFETSLAKITSASDERHNVSGLYQRMTLGDLKAYSPQLDWHKYLLIVLNKSCGFDEPIVMFALRYIHDLTELLSETPSRIVANYLLWRFVRHRVKNLDNRYQEAEQQFYYVINGREKAPSRWKYCVTDVNNKMGMAVSAMFVKKYFDENSKNYTLTMTKEIQQSFNEILQDTNWIGRETKTLASEKVNTMTLKVGYPDFILVADQLNERYKDVSIHPDQYFENSLNILRHLTRVEQGHLGTPVNKSVWNTAPAVVNAYYSRIKNQIMFPAGILQPPFYHKYFPPSLNYGGIGVVIGHEITHGFDDKGRLFDKFGNLHRWWKDLEINNFHERAQCLIEQYSKYTVPEVGIALDGINTQGENIADNGGIKQAFRAYERWVKAHGSGEDFLPDINATGHQLFFLNFAQVWCGNTRPEALKNGLKTAVHSPGQFRVIGTLSNSYEFSNIYNCPSGAPMNPKKKCSVW